jgi:membrane protease YdiL (CAAX protease family)
MEHVQDTPSGPNWRQIVTYLAATFGLTYLLNLVLYLTVGYSDHPATLLLLQLQMLIPAAAAIVLGLFAFKSSPIYRTRSPLRWFLYAYLAYALLFVVLAVGALWIEAELYLIFVNLATLGLGLGLLAIVVLARLIGGRQAFARTGLGGGRPIYYVTFSLLLVTIYLVMTGLNALFGLGETVNLMDLLQTMAGDQATGLEGIPPAAVFALIAVQSVVLGPLLGLPMAFGEEYGWRGFLQSELVKMGKARGILLLGIIWGVWHAPIIAMGHNYPGYPLLGPVVMTLYTIGLGFFLGYAVLKSGSVWLAAFLHGLNNQVASFLFVAVYRPDDPLFSFGTGLYGIAVWAVVVAALLLLDRKAWTGPAEPPALPVAEEGVL